MGLLVKYVSAKPTAHSLCVTVMMLQVANEKGFNYEGPQADLL